MKQDTKKGVRRLYFEVENVAQNYMLQVLIIG